MTHKRALFLFILALVLAAPVAVGSIERAVEPSGSGLDITLTVTDLPVGGIVETLPDGCTWVETDHPADRTRVSGSQVAFAVVGEETIRYSVQGPKDAAERFVGTWEDYHTLTGASGSVGADETQTSETETAQNSSVLATETDAVPCDLDGDGTVTDSELATAILDSLDVRYMGGTGEAPSVVDLQDAVFVIEHWKGQALTITDTSERTTTVYRPLRRIVLLHDYLPKVTQLLGVEHDRIVGVETNIFEDPLFYPDYQGKADVGMAQSPNYEQVMLTHPDAVIFGTSSSTDKDEQTLGSIPGIHFFRFDCYKLPTYADDVQKLGLLLGKQEEAERFLAFRGNVLDNVAEVVDRIPAEDRVSVYRESGDYSASGKESTYHEMIELAGGRNIFADISSSSVNPEEVIIRNPDVIIKNAGGRRSSYSNETLLSSLETLHRSVMNRPGWDHINAVKDSRVYITNGPIYSGSQKFIGIAYMAKWFYPDLFPDLDPKAIHQQYLSEFQRLDYDLDKHGAFVYPT